jgi:hydrogenase maturation protein HypF
VRVGLSGGVFQNRVLTEQAQVLLTGAGFQVLIPERLPMNDASISYGQLVEDAALQAVEPRTR